ncbi:MAG TPA: nucleoside triphosphate pyrophosphohydrolase [Desulfobacterales bacterium]|nr:nucleoside triphosphate pyrophosphohydrolase [Desulfobacterales bacterium]
MHTTSGIDSLMDVIKTLRGEGGCPWDKKQTPRSMTVYLIEEIYELVEAIESGKTQDVCEELGDVLFHVLFLSRMYQEMGEFDIHDVTEVNIEKMIRRHPHVFGGKRVNTAEEVKQRWHQIKMKEKNHRCKTSILDSVPPGLPALVRAYRISERAARTGFDWNDIVGVMQKVEEEWFELKSELRIEENQSGRDSDKIAMEFGDVLFAMVNVARFLHIHPETALRSSIKKFEKRFQYMEKVFSEAGRSLESASQNEMETVWEAAKQKAK